MSQLPKIVEINIHPRLHITLLGMNYGGYRINGGVGFAVSNPSCQVVASRTQTFQVRDTRNKKDPNLENQLLELLHKEQSVSLLPFCISLSISGDMPSHYGFGSGTAIRLASLEALHILNGKVIAPSDLIRASGRGGTSGIGIKTYFDGGLVFDVGKSNKGATHLPSGFVTADQTPLCLGQQNLPSWGIGICIPTSITPKTPQEELAFFRATCPLKDEYVYETLYHVAFGIYPSIIERDKETFCQALRAIQNCAWKKAERQEYGAQLKRLEDQIYEYGADTVAMSSLGPSLFFLADDVELVRKRILDNSLPCDTYSAIPMNNGREVRTCTN